METTKTLKAPEARSFPRGVWTGKELIVWGGTNLVFTDLFTTAGRYNPSKNVWKPISTLNVPDGRIQFQAVWTGTEMIVWGGRISTKTGGRYNPLTDSWIGTKSKGAPLKRQSHTAVWTGDKMIIWGGFTTKPNDVDVDLNTGGIYDPVSNTWVKF